MCIRDRIWTDGAEYVDENALSVTIKRLRDKLGAQKYIKTEMCIRDRRYIVLLRFQAVAVALLAEGQVK